VTLSLKFNRVLKVVEVDVCAKFHQAKTAVYELSTVH